MFRRGRFLYWICLWLAGLLLASCAPLQPGSLGVPQDPLGGTQWRLVSFGTPGESTPALDGYQPTLNFEGGVAQGKAGCNSYYTEEYTISGDSLSLGMLAWTEMACLDAEVMEQETAYLALLGSVERFSLKDKRLTLTSPEGILLFEPLGPAEGISLEGQLWRLEGFAQSSNTTATIEGIEKRYSITAWFEDGIVSGSSGCNSYGGAYESDPETSSLVISGPFEMTAQECLDEVGAQYEARFIEAMQTAESYRIAGEQLAVIYPDWELIFRLQPDPVADEMAIYEALLREWDDGSGLFIIRETTGFNKPGKTLDETLEAVKEQLVSMAGAHPLTPDPAIFDDFQANNSDPKKLSELQIDFPTILISDETLGELFANGETAGWQTFQEQYPDANGIFTLSRAGFNESGDQALVYLGQQGEDFNGGWYSFMVKQNGTWGATVSFIIWGE